MKGEVLLKILEIIEDAVYTTEDIMDAFLSSSKINYSAMRNFRPRHKKTYAESIREKMKEKSNVEKIKEADKQSVYNLLGSRPDNSMLK